MSAELTFDSSELVPIRPGRRRHGPCAGGPVPPREDYDPLAPMVVEDDRVLIEAPVETRRWRREWTRYEKLATPWKPAQRGAYASPRANDLVPNEALIGLFCVPFLCTLLVWCIGQF